MFVSIIPVSRLSLSLSVSRIILPMWLLFLSTLWPCAKWWTMVAMAMCNWPHAIWRFYRSRIICSTQPTTVPWHSLAVCVCVLYMCYWCVHSQCLFKYSMLQPRACDGILGSKQTTLEIPSKTPQVTWLQSSYDDSQHFTSPVKYDLSRFLLLYDHFLSKARPSGLRCCSPDQSHQTQLLHGRRRGWKIEKISDGQQPPKHGRICS